MIRLEDLNCTFHAGTPNAKTVIRDLNLTVKSRRIRHHHRQQRCRQDHPVQPDFR
jgi:hypothetical protein